MSHKLEWFLFITLILIALGALLSGCASSGVRIGGRPIATQPPAQFNHSYRGNLTIRFVDRSRLTPVCRSATAHGCALRMDGGKRCDVYILAGTAYDIDSIKRHEIGHCNGWPSDHRMY